MPRQLTTILASGLLVLGLAACGSEPDVEATPAPTASEQEETTDDVVETRDNPLVLGFTITGPAGTVIESSSATMVGDVAQQELDQTWSLSGEPETMLFTVFVDSAEVAFDVVEGGPATVVGFRGNYKDVNDPFGGHVVAEELSTVEVAIGANTVLNLP